MKIRKAVIAVAGYGTRFLPATKVQPKEMLPVVDKPIVQYLVEEAVQSGIEDIILVTRSGSQAITDHFDSSRELEIHLAEQQKQAYLEIVQAIPRLANFAFIRQGRHLPYGNGTPLLAAKDFIDEGEPFVYMFGDDLVLSETPCVKQLIDVYMQHRPAAVVAFQELPLEEAIRYGLARVKEGTNPKELESIVEKPSLEEAPSTLAQFGRFVLPWRTIEILETMEPGLDNELYLTDANHILCREARVLAHTIEGVWYTTGDPLRFLQTNVQYALRHPEIGRAFAEYLRSLDLSQY
ncbi:MAG: UTP--glucose-1-phosphate uridylyltransferase [Pirellulales bacterium]|nr:UTP--glucose-1-phosphate uridylyltransferase [Pirellulales bacterium]